MLSLQYCCLSFEQIIKSHVMIVPRNEQTSARVPSAFRQSQTTWITYDATSVCPYDVLIQSPCQHTHTGHGLTETIVLIMLNMTFTFLIFRLTEGGRNMDENH